MRSVFMGVAMMGVMHIYFHFTQPLFIQGLMGLKNIYDAPLVSIHLLGKPAVDSLARPFKVASMLGGTRLFISTPFLSTSCDFFRYRGHATIMIFSSRFLSAKASFTPSSNLSSPLFLPRPTYLSFYLFHTVSFMQHSVCFVIVVPLLNPILVL